MNQRKSLLIDLGSGGGGTPGRWANPVRWGYQPSWVRIGVTSNSHHIRTITILKVTIARKSLTAMKG